MKNSTLPKDWLYIISPKKSLFSLNLKEVWSYRDLLLLFVRRDVVTMYKQTILGPLWYLIQPLFTSVIFTLVFNNIANIETGDGIPNFLFNLAGITCWNYFSSCLTDTSTTFTKNQHIFSKVYFPRVITPLSVVISNMIKFGIQMLVFTVFYMYFYISLDSENMKAVPSIYLLLFPALVLCMALLGLGLGMIISSLTTKYRDLSFLVGFGVQLLMYASAVMYPISLIKQKVSDGTLPKIFGYLVEYNPMSSVIELNRNILLSTGDFSWGKIIYALVISIFFFLLGLIIFNRTEKTFIDTV